MRINNKKIQLKFQLFVEFLEGTITCSKILYECFCRRAAGGKFVPPVKRDQEDDINEEIRSRVLYGSNKGSGNGGQSSKGLPPELEGDERLRNVEPRMVELIMNEVHDPCFPAFPLSSL